MARLGPLYIIFVIFVIAFLTGCTAGRETIEVTATPGAPTETALLDDPLANRAIAASDLPKIPAGWVVDCVDAHNPANVVVVRQFCKPGVWNTPAITPSPTVDLDPTVTPIPTNTPRTPTTTYTPTQTLGPTLTPTRRPTKKPTATRTATPTATGTDDAPPQETLDPNEPTPPDGPEKQCLTRNLSNGPFNIRADHVNDATIVGQVPNAEYAAVDRIFVISTGVDEWFHVAHTRANGVIIRGWMHWTKTAGLEFPAADTDELCWDLPIEGGSATYTPVPTQAGPTATAQPPIILGCDVFNPTAGNINVRSGPGLAYAVIEKFTPGESGIALRVHVVSTSEEWANFSQLSSGGQNVYGYIALKIGGSALAALRGDSCPDVPRVQGAAGIPDGGPFASGKILPGVHISWPTNFDAAALAPYIGIAKCLPLTDNICRVLKQHNPAIVTIWRDYRIENPTDYELRVDHTGYASRVYALAQLDFDYQEVMNELGFTSAQYPYLSDFMIDVADYFGDRGECILAPAFGPGWPDLRERQWNSIVSYIAWSNKNPCGVWADGTPKYHGLSWHAAAFYPGDAPAWPWVNDPNVAGNAIEGNRQMKSDTGIGIEDMMGPKIVTELGATDIYGGYDTTRPSCEQNRMMVNRTKEVYALYSKIFDGFAWWNFGSPGNWIDETRCLPGMFQ